MASGAGTRGQGGAGTRGPRHRTKPKKKPRRAQREGAGTRATNKKTRRAQREGAGHQGTQGKTFAAIAVNLELTTTAIISKSVTALTKGQMAKAGRDRAGTGAGTKRAGSQGPKRGPGTQATGGRRAGRQRAKGRRNQRQTNIANAFSPKLGNMVIGAYIMFTVMHAEMRRGFGATSETIRGSATVHANKGVQGLKHDGAVFTLNLAMLTAESVLLNLGGTAAGNGLELAVLATKNGLLNLAMLTAESVLLNLVLLATKNGLKGNTVDANVASAAKILLLTTGANIELPLAAVGEAMEALQKFSVRITVRTFLREITVGMTSMRVISTL